MLLKEKNARSMEKLHHGDSKMGAIRQLFETIDSNANNEIDSKEFLRGLSSLGVHLNPHQMETFTAEIDINHDGFIGFEEFSNKVIEVIDWLID